MDAEKLKQIQEALIGIIPWYAADANGDEYVTDCEPGEGADSWESSTILRFLVGHRDMDGIDWRTTKERIG